MRAKYYFLAAAMLFGQAAIYTNQSTATWEKLSLTAITFGVLAYGCIIADLGKI